MLQKVGFYNIADFDTFHRYFLLDPRMGLGNGVDDPFKSFVVNFIFVLSIVTN